MGEAVVYAAYVCKKYETFPWGVYQNYLEEFIGLLDGNTLEIQPKPIDQELKNE